jgi:predicted RNase H-like HicB family nuclease
MVSALPGCFSTGDTFEAAQKNVNEAIRLHTRGMLQDGEELPGESVFIVAHADVDVKTKVG